MIYQLLGILIEGVKAFALPLLLYFKGRKDVNAKLDKEDAKILKKQRDNNITNARNADLFWMRKRKK